MASNRTKQNNCNMIFILFLFLAEHMPVRYLFWFWGWINLKAINLIMSWLCPVHLWSWRCAGESLPGKCPQLCVFFCESVGESVWVSLIIVSLLLTASHWIQCAWLSVFSVRQAGVTPGQMHSASSVWERESGEFLLIPQRPPGTSSGQLHS